MKKIPGLMFGNLKTNVHLPLLAFLLIFTIDKIVLKFAGILLIYLLHPDFNFRKNFKKIPLFYPLLVGLEGIKFLLFNKDFSNGHIITFLIGCLFWIIGFLALHQFRSIIDETEENKIGNTLKIFFLVNCAISLLNLLLAMYHSGSLNPYRLSDTNYGSSTGDLIRGLFSGPSYINMMINALFIFYFLYKKEFRFATAGMVIALFTTANFGNLVLLPVLFICLIFNKDRQVKLAILSFLGLFLAFYLIISPNNLRYLKDSIWVPEKRQKELLAYELKNAVRQEKRDSMGLSKEQEHVKINEKNIYDPGKVNDMVKQLHPDSSHAHLLLKEKYGKVQAFKETGRYLISSPRAFVFGAGIGSFSSFLAMRVSGVNREEGSRLFNYIPTYISPEFKNNHYNIYRIVYGLPREFHSIKHFPNSFLNQLFGEYGVAGALLFLFTYVLFFAKYYRKLTYGKYLLFLLGGFLFFDYLFEYLSIVAVFELLMLCDIKRTEDKTSGNPKNSLQAKGI